jgi:hypothetical protein
MDIFLMTLILSMSFSVTLVLSLIGAAFAVTFGLSGRNALWRRRGDDRRRRWR